LYELNDYAAEGDDSWQPHVINHYYGESFPVRVPSRSGKNVGFTDWTHGAATPSPLVAPTLLRLTRRVPAIGVQRE
jgi:hypothetical protein